MRLDFSLPKFPNVQVKTRFFVRTSKSQIECWRNANNKQNQQTTIQLPFFRDSTLNSSIWYNQTCVYDFSLPKFPNVQVKMRFLSERRNRRSNAVSIIWARVQQRRFTGEIIVPKQLYFEKALICLCKTCGQSIRTYCVIFLQWNDVAEHTFREIDEWNFVSSQKGFVVRRNALGV